MWQLVVPHFGLGLGLGVVDSSLMPLLAKLVEDRHVGAYGSVFAVSQTAVSLAYGIGPLCGGFLAERFGFPMVMRVVGLINILYSPVLFYLANTNHRGRCAEVSWLEYFYIFSILLNFMNDILVLLYFIEFPFA